MPHANYNEQKPDLAPRWPKYISHKEVHALKLQDVKPDDIAEGYTKFTPADEAYPPLIYPNSAEVVKRCKAMDMYDPGYIVMYADGFLSWSPTTAFERGYIRAPG